MEAAQVQKVTTAMKAGSAPVVETLRELDELGLELDAGTYLLIASATFTKKGPVQGPVVVTLNFGELPGRAIFGFAREEEEGIRRPITVVSDARFQSSRRVALSAHVSGSGDENIRVSDISIVALKVSSLTVEPLRKKTKQ